MDSGTGPIGILDSGVGGLTVLKEVIRQLPGEDIIYYGDTLHLPYGPRDLGQVREFVFKVCDFLLQKKKCKAIVLACNTATSAALNSVRQKYTTP
ncbi:MAG: glutamate racemase, partial [Halanaerobiales bacterium]